MPMVGEMRSLFTTLLDRSSTCTTRLRSKGQNRAT